MNRLIIGVMAGVLARKALNFYHQYKLLDDFGNMKYDDAVKLVVGNDGTVAQQERLVQLAIAKMHAAADARQLSAQTLDPQNPEDMAKLKELLTDSKHESNTGQYL